LYVICHAPALVPEVRLLDEEGRGISEKHYKPGSTVELHCVVTGVPAEADHAEMRDVAWLHNGNVIKENSDRGGIR
jgi:hypothetical protein